MYNTYILQSTIDHRYYIGSCEDVEKRLNQHNTGRVRATKYGIPWDLVYKEQFENRKDAYRRELQIKSYKGGRAFKELIHENNTV